MTTAKETLREAVEDLSETEAAEVLDLLIRRNQRDSLTWLLDNAPVDDEPETAEERAAVAEGREALRRGEIVSADEIRAEFLGTVASG